MNYGNNVDEQIIIDKLKKYKLDEVFSELSDGIQSSCGVYECKFVRWNAKGYDVDPWNLEALENSVSR